MPGSASAMRLAMPPIRQPERVAAWLLAIAPAVWLAALALGGDLGGRPVTEAIRFTGDWSLRLLWLALLVSPARRILAAPRLIRARRALGLGAFGLTALHVGLYAFDLQFEWSQIALEIVLRVYLWVGAIATVGLAMLAASSSDRAITRLGSARWNVLHSAVYGLAALSVLHFLLRSRTNTFEPMLMIGLLGWLMGYRLLHRLAGVVSPAMLLGLAVAAAALTGIAQVSWYAAETGVDPWRVLAAHAEFAYGLQPAWWVLFAGLGAAAAGWRFGLPPHRSAARISTSKASPGSARGQSPS